MADSKWQPNLNAKPFIPSSAAYIVRLPCCTRPLKIRRRGMLGRFLQGLLVSVLAVTVIFNIIFIIDNSKKLRSASPSSVQNEALDNEFANQQFLQEQSVAHSEDNGKMVKIEARSSKELVYVAVDGVKVYEDGTTDDTSRGLHIVVLNQQTGMKMSSRVYDTYGYVLDGEIVLYLNMLQEGRIIVFLTKDEASFHLKKAGKSILRAFGSKFIDNLKWRDNWAFIMKKKKKWLAESLEKSPAMDKWPPAVVIQANFLLASDEDTCDYGTGEVAARRKTFCDKYEGYGSVCDCKNPSPIDLKGEPLPNNRVSELPVAVIAADRPQYLYRMLRGLLTVRGADPKMVTVYIDGFFDEPAAVATLFNVKAVQHTPVCSKNCRIGQHYKKSLTTTFDAYPHANQMIILEEDLDCSKDIFDYFSQMLPLLEKDPSIYCVSAWNDQGYEHSCNDPALLYRVETMPGLGWMLKRKMYKEELEPRWPGPTDYWDWDMWMRLNSNRKGRECIIPDISRTYHFGAKGINMNSFFQDMYFTKHALNRATDVVFNITKVTKENYDIELHNIMKNAIAVNHTKNQCSHKEDFIPDTKGETYVVYIKMDHFSDWETWTNLAGCFRIWDLDVRGYHKGLWRFWYKQNHILLVGAPYSPFASYKPKHLKPVFIPKKKKKEEGKN
eukprot:gene17702-19471_t